MHCHTRAGLNSILEETLGCERESESWQEMAWELSA